MKHHYKSTLDVRERGQLDQPTESRTLETRDTFKPAAKVFKWGIEGLDQFDQSAQLARLWECAQKVATGHPSFPIRRGVVRFLKMHLLRYGNLRASKYGMRGFGVVRDSDAFRDFVYSRILPEEFVYGFLLSCVSYGLMALEVVINADVPEFTFALAGATEAEMSEVWDECERNFDQNPTELVN